MQVYAGAPYQRGYGLGRVMKNILRQATPLLKHAGRKALKTGISVVAKGFLDPKRKQTVKKKGKRRRKTVSRKIASPATQKKRLAAMGFKPFSALNSQTGSGRVVKKRKMKRAARDIFSHK